MSHIIHKKVFTRWCNTVLAARDLAITNFSEDLQSGVLLANLIEILSSKRVMHNPLPQNRIQAIDNLSSILSHLQREEELHLVNIGPMDIVDGNDRLTLGLIWSLILRFKIKAPEGGQSIFEAILAWLAGKGIAVGGFGEEWCDGRILCHLVDEMSGGITGLGARCGASAVENCKMAMDYAEEWMGIPKVMDPEDMAKHCDAQVNLTYITYFWQFEKDGKRIEVPEEELREAEQLKHNERERERRRQEEEHERAEELKAQREAEERAKQLEISLQIQLQDNTSTEVANADVNLLDEYMKNLRIERERERARTVDVSKCIAYGPGLKTPGMVGINATFTIEARNTDNNIIPEGGHDFEVSITAVAAENIPLVVVDQENGKYTVQYNPPAPGTYVIGITLKAISISGSPYTVEIINYKDAPVPHWFYQKNKTEWAPFPEELSENIENIYDDLLAFSGGKGGTCVSYDGVQYNIDFTNMKETKKKRSILRATWFFIDDDNITWRPFESGICEKLEDAYQNSQLERVETSFQPRRHVSQIGPDSFRQFRTTKNGNPVGRLVNRGWKNQKCDAIPRHLKFG